MPESHQTPVLHLRWVSNGKVIACGAGTGELAPKASAVTCQECRATLPWQISALIEPFEQLAAVYRQLGENMARALRLMPGPETRRTAEEIIRNYKPGESLFPWLDPAKPLTGPVSRPLILTRLRGAITLDDEETR